MNHFTKLKTTTIGLVGVLALTLTMMSSTAANADFAPIPDIGRGVHVDPQKGYYVEAVSDGLYWVTDGIFMSMFLTTGEGVILVDSPPSLGDKLLNAIAEVTDEPITHFIYSHAHVDHTGGAGSLPGTVTYIAHAETAELLTRAQDTRRPVPSVTFEDA